MMPDAAIITEWVSFMFRWLHVVAAMAWIGTSFFFIALDLGLRPTPGMPKGGQGDEWHVHGGGFYHFRKYLVAPEHLPGRLIWHKWQSYTTWLTGAALLAIIYWLRGEIYLLDPSGMPLELWQGIAISAGSLAIGWIVYDLLCKSPLGHRPTLLMILLFAMLVGMSWGYAQIFTGRAALVHLGAFTATIMTANVFFRIIPGQRIVVAALTAGREPDPEIGRIAKLRSTHNNYLTLPVVFLMLSVHYPLVFATGYNWLMACLVFLTGVLMRHYFNSLHASDDPKYRGPLWTWLGVAAIIIAMMMLSATGSRNGDTAANHSPDTETVPDGTVQDIITFNCTLCHTRDRNSLWPGLAAAPNGVYLETARDIALNAEAIYINAGISRAMPPPGVIEMEPGARQTLINWYRQRQIHAD